MNRMFDFADVEQLTARAIAKRVSSDPQAVMLILDHVFERIRQRNDQLNALTYVANASAYEQAKNLPSRLRSGETLPLAGVPVVVKDNIYVHGMPVSQGSRLFDGFVGPRDAVAIERLRHAGAIIIGIGACPEFAVKGFTNTAKLGVTRHPTHPDLTPGGSSGGNVAAVAAGFAPVSLGTDGGGSSRRPPAHCGLVGFKPSFGAIPHPFGFAEPFWNITCLAPIARDVADCALMFGVVAGPDVRDPDSRILLPPTARPVEALRMAVAPMLGLDAPFDRDVMAAFERAVARLSMRFQFKDAAPRWPKKMTADMLMAVQHAGLAAIHGQRFSQEPHLFDPDVAVQIERGLTLKGAEVADALETSQCIRRAVSSFFVDHDILISLTTPCTAWPNSKTYPETIGGQPVGPRGHAVLTPMFNHAQTPAISIPCGEDDKGLPVGLQIVGPVGSDWTVLAVAQAFEDVLKSN